MSMHLIDQHDIAVRTNYSLQYVRNLASRADFPAHVAKRGKFKLYCARIVDKYFASRIDLRYRENKRRK